MRYQLKVDVLPIIQKDTTTDLTKPLKKEDWIELGINPDSMSHLFEEIRSVEDIIFFVNVDDMQGKHDNRLNITIELQGPDIGNLKNLKDVEVEFKEAIKVTLHKIFEKERTLKRIVSSRPKIFITETDSSVSNVETPEDESKKARKELVASICSVAPYNHRYCNAEYGCGCMGCINTYRPFLEANITYEEWYEWKEENNIKEPVKLWDLNNFNKIIE